MAELYGNTEPRLWTPPLRPLTPETTLGPAVAEFSRKVCGIEPFPWQEWLLWHGLELLEDNSFRFRNVVALVARQNGKSFLSQILALFNMYVLGSELVLGTAQDLDTAEEVWQGAVDLVESTPELNDLKKQVMRVNGKKSLEIKGGKRYRVKAANRKAGRGLSGELILLDELREHQNWESWGAITKTTMAQSNAQVWALSNAGDVTSVVLRYLRKMAHQQLGDPDGVNAADDPIRMVENQDELDPDDIELDTDDSLGIFEWSAPPGVEQKDTEGWKAANPALGYGISRRAIDSASKTDPERVFRTEVLCQWMEQADEGPFPTGSWEETSDPESTIGKDSPISIGVDVSWNHSASYIAIAGWRPDGDIHVEIAEAGYGTEWVTRWLTSSDRHSSIQNAPVALQTSGSPAAELLTEFQDAGIPVIDWKGTSVTQGASGFYNKVQAAQNESIDDTPLRHLPEPVLDVAASTAVTKPAGDVWMWDRRKSPNDIAPLIAATAAVWALCQPKEKPSVSAYDQGARLEVL